MKLRRVGRHYVRVPLTRTDRIIAGLLGIVPTREVPRWR